MTIAALMMMVCVRFVGLRVPSSCCGSPWPPHRLSSLGPLLLRTCSRWHSIPIGSPSPPSQKTKYSTRLAVLIWKTKILVQGEFNPSLPRPSTASRAPPLSSDPASCQFPPSKPRLRRSVARGGACLRSRASRLSIAAAPLLP